MTSPLPEVLVCDTSYLGAAFRVRARSDLALTDDRLARINAATLAISVFTEAEVRMGWRYAKWGETRIAASSHALAAYVRLPLDEGVLDLWAELAAARKSRGKGGLSDNDLWIAATALGRGYPLVSCDADHGRDLPEIASGLEVIYLPPDALAG